MLTFSQAATRNLTSAPCYYETVPKEHWSLPDWIDEGRFMNSLEYLGAIGVGKGWMISYRHMCRWNSGFFYKHPRLLEFDWYWRVEPDVRGLSILHISAPNACHFPIPKRLYHVASAHSSFLSLPSQS